MNRATMIKIHLYLSGISIVFFSLFIITGSSHLFGIDENETKKVVETMENQSIESKEQLEELFTKMLNKVAPTYRYDYIKGNPTSLITRPTTRTYYRIQFDRDSSQAILSEHTPDWNKRFMELHKGHGAKISKKILASIAILFFLSICSGIWLGLTVAAYRKITLATCGTGLLLFILLFSL